MKRATVHPTHNRPEPIRVDADSWVDARNRSCEHLDRGYERIGVREGFVMIPKGKGPVVVILPPESANVKL